MCFFVYLSIHIICTFVSIIAKLEVTYYLLFRNKLNLCAMKQDKDLGKLHKMLNIHIETSTINVQWIKYQQKG